MTFAVSGLALVGNAGNSDAPRIWTYKSADTFTTLDDADYFLNASDLLKVGDLIFAIEVHATTGALEDAGLLIVNSVSATAVDTSDATDLLVTDGA